MMSFPLELPGLSEIDENYSIFILNEIKNQLIILIENYEAQ